MRIARLAFAAFALSLAAPAVAQEVTTQVYELPKGARVLDVAPAPDVSIWYTAQRQGALGILDPKTRRREALLDYLESLAASAGRRGSPRPGSTGAKEFR